jgi:hypothetical protein
MITGARKKSIPRKKLTDMALALYTSNPLHKRIRRVVFEPENETSFVVGKVVAPLFFAILHYEL